MNRHLVTLAAFLVTVPAYAAPPEKGSKQWERMQDYKIFISTLHRPDGQFCCTDADARIGDGGNELKEERIVTKNPDPEKEDIVSYRVFVTRDIWGKDSHNPDNPASTINHEYEKLIPPEGRWFDITPDKVLIGDQTDVKKCLTQIPECAAPPNNVLWLGYSERDDGYVEEMLYCYFPISHWTQNGTKQYARLEP